ERRDGFRARDLAAVAGCILAHDAAGACRRHGGGAWPAGRAARPHHIRGAARTVSRYALNRLDAARADAANRFRGLVFPAFLNWTHNWNFRSHPENPVWPTIQPMPAMRPTHCRATSKVCARART